MSPDDQVATRADAVDDPGGLLRVTVPLADGRDYPVVIGDGAIAELPSLIPGRARRVAVVTQPGIPVEVDPGREHRVFRIGDGEGSWNADPAKRKLLPGSQFPAEAYDNYMKQTVPRWLSTDNAVLAAYIALVDRACPCAILAHSQGGIFAFKAAEARPDKVRAIVAVESASAGVVANAGKLKDTADGDKILVMPVK